MNSTSFTLPLRQQLTSSSLRWNTLKTHEAILDHLQADIICFQEMKSSRQTLPKSVAIPPSYESFFSFPTNKKGGYSGVATYTRHPIIPLKASDHLGGSDLDLELELETDVSALDSEGRTIITDFGLFVLINVYCPNDSGEGGERTQFKMDFHRLLQERVRVLVEVENREVIVVGDLNACAAVIDHCEGEIIIKREGKDEEGFFEEMPSRAWLRNWLVERGGCFVDVVRRAWPDRKGMYTCWNTKLSARASNYGTRIDYILLTPGLLPWVKAADIEPGIKGSDHCPVWVELHEEVDGVRLRDLLTPPPGVEPPRLSARCWDEYSGKQKLLGDFFGRKGKDASPTPSPSASQSSRSTTSQSSNVSNTKKRKPTPPLPPPTTKKQKHKGQSKLSSFFSHPPNLNAKSKNEDEDEDEDYKLALSLSLQFSPPPPPPPPRTTNNKNNADAWKTLLTPPSPPLCTVHKEPAKEFVVNKPGVNKGRMFWVCARPVGPGYDKGRGERSRDEVDPQWKCDFFKWSSEVNSKKGPGPGVC